MNGVWKGALLALANLFVIGIGIAALEHQANIAMLVIVFGGVPGLLAGVSLGVMASVTSTAPVPVRIGTLATPAVLVVFGLAHEFGMQDLAYVSCIPTVVAALILERWTRQVDAPPVPVARLNQ